MRRSLSEEYARRARKFSETVARLGEHNEITPEVLKLFQEIKRQRALCSDAEEKFERYLRQGDNSKTAGVA
jgi:hypothetical protein